MPFISLYLRDRGLDFTQISVIFLVSSGMLLVFPFLWGMLADRVVPMNRLFAILNVLSVGALALLGSQDTFAGLLLGCALFYACYNPTLTLINALGFHHLARPREQFANLRAWGSLGWIVPSLPIYLWLAKSRNDNLEFVLYLGIGLSLAMAVVTFFLPHTPPGASGALNPVRDLGYWPAMKRLLYDPNYVTLLISFFLVASSFSILVLYSPPFLEDNGVDRAWIGPIQCIGVVLEIILFRWRGLFVQHFSDAGAILFGCVCLVGRQLLFAFSESAWLLSASYLLAGMVIVYYHIGASILANAIALREVRATAQALLVFFGSGLGPMFANGIAGRLAAAADQSLRPVFLFAAALAGLAALLVAVRAPALNRAAAGEIDDRRTDLQIGRKLKP